MKLETKMFSSEAGFSSVQDEISKRLMGCLGAFIWMLAYKEKNTDTASKTKSQPERKDFRVFRVFRC